MIDLKAIRYAAGLTLRDMAGRLGLSERSGRVTVSQIEVRKDWKLSSLGAYFRACEATGELVVSVNGQVLRFEL